MPKLKKNILSTRIICRNKGFHMNNTVKKITDFVHLVIIIYCSIINLFQ